MYVTVLGGLNIATYMEGYNIYDIDVHDILNFDLSLKCLEYKPHGTICDLMHYANFDIAEKTFSVEYMLSVKPFPI